MSFWEFLKVSWDWLSYSSIFTGMSIWGVFQWMRAQQEGSCVFAFRDFLITVADIILLVLLPAYFLFVFEGFETYWINLTLKIVCWYLFLSNMILWYLILSTVLRKD